MSQRSPEAAVRGNESLDAEKEGFLSSTFPEINNFIGGGVPLGHGDLYNF
jgi:hypothetical protein